MLPEEIIIAPVVTEKSNDELQEGKYTFKVNKKATKVEIAKAVEKLFEVKVLKVNTIQVKLQIGKKRLLQSIQTQKKKLILQKAESKLRYLKNIKILLMNLWELKNQVLYDFLAINI